MIYHSFLLVSPAYVMAILSCTYSSNHLTEDQQESGVVKHNPSSVSDVACA